MQTAIYAFRRDRHGSGAFAAHAAKGSQSRSCGAAIGDQHRLARAPLGASGSTLERTMHIHKAALVSLLAFGIAAPAFAQTAAGTGTPSLDQREQNQQTRIEQGINSGALKAGEAAQLEKREQTLQNKEAAAKSDGTVTAKERHQLKRTAKRDSTKIAKAKHNAKTNPNPPSAQ
jgi:hypothetical protein